MSDIHTQFEQAVALHQQGHYKQAQELYEHLLTVLPEHAELWHLSGVLAHQQGNYAEAADRLQQAIALDAQPHYFFNLGNAWQHMQTYPEAIKAYGQAIALAPEMVPAHVNRGQLFLSMGDTKEAIDAFEQALQLQPDADLHVQLGNLLLQQKNNDRACHHYEHALQMRPDFFEAWNNLGNIYKDQRQLDKAIPCYQKSLAINPDFAEAHINLGNVLIDRGELAAAIEHFQATLLKDEFKKFVPRTSSLVLPKAYTGLGNAYLEMGELEKSEQAYDTAIELAPDDHEARYNRSYLYLLTGRFEEGFRDYELRLNKMDFPGCPFWDGSFLPQGRIILLAEQGLGDTIQFARYAPQVKKRVGHVTLACQPSLQRLLRSYPGIDAVIDRQQANPTEFDAHIPLMSLAHIFGTTHNSIPAILGGAGLEPAPLRIGLVWAGSPTNRNDWKRSIPFEHLSPLLEISGIEWYSLQIPPLPTPKTPKTPKTLPHIHDFYDTALAIAELDLVISVDTAVAHLAGTMGKPVWILLPHIPDWRWLLDREDSPWYPSARLFRQKKPGDWAGVVQRVKDLLGNFF